jgi:cysteine desulfurase family protein
MEKVYVDNSATSFPKAPGVSDAIKDYLDNTGCNVNRGGYADAYGVALEILEARQMLAELFHTQNPQEVVFTPGITFALNLLLLGYLKPGDHVITTSMEHNAVMRPLHVLAQKGIVYDIAPCAENGALKARDIIPYIRKESKAVVMLHASNVCGTILPIDEVAEICHKHHLKLMVDAAQTAGFVDIDASAIDALAFTGHKNLLGPQGIGGFIIKKAFAASIEPLITGGTGSLSHELTQPHFLPDKFESGTMNIPAILGLKKALAYINSIGIKNIHDKETHLKAAFIAKMSALKGVRLIGAKDVEAGAAVVSLDFPGKDNAAIATALDRNYGIMTRCGLHCAPLAHHTLHTYPQGTVRFSFGYFNSMDDVEFIAQSIKEIMQRGADCGI